MDGSFFAVRDRRSRAATMLSAKFIACLLSILSGWAMAKPMFAQTFAQKRIVIAASTVLDGKGRVLHDTRIVIEGSKIVAIDPKAGAGGLRPARPDCVAWLD